jgi:hypothetical protein
VTSWCFFLLFEGFLDIHGVTFYASERPLGSYRVCHQGLSIAYLPMRGVLEILCRKAGNGFPLNIPKVATQCSFEARWNEHRMNYLALLTPESKVPGQVGTQRKIQCPSHTT